MIPVTQTKVSVNNSKGEKVIYGNCFAACVASLLELPITEVPNIETLFDMDMYHQEVLDKWLNHKGYEMSVDDRLRCFHPNLPNYIDSPTYREEFRDKYYLVSGKSPRGVMHMTIYKNGRMVWDPHPTKEGLLTEEIFETIERK